MAAPWCVAAVCSYALLFSICVTVSQALNPVILVPGDGGSQMLAKLNKTSSPHYFCEKHTNGYYTLWLALEDVTPFFIDCFVDNMRLHYNQSTHTTHNTEGVDIQIPDFGQTTSVEWLSPSDFVPFTSYFHPIVDAMVSWGYVRGKSVRGAPYDFRKAPNEFKDFYVKFKALVEDTYTKNNNTPVVILAHSMGNPTSLFFLNQQPQAWKDKYISKFITLAGVWGGVIKTMRLMASGDNLGIPIVNPLLARPEQRSMPSTAWLLPSTSFWNSSEILVSRPGRNYTIQDLQQFFTDLNFEDGYLMRKDTEMLIHDLTAPGVEVHCLHGSKVATPGVLVYDNDKYKWPDSQPLVIPDPDTGDGTVNMRSLLGCLRWQGKQKAKVYHQVFPGAEHMEILENKDIIAYLKKVLAS